MPETLLSTEAQLGLSFSGTHPPPPGQGGPPLSLPLLRSAPSAGSTEKLQEHILCCQLSTSYLCFFQQQYLRPRAPEGNPEPEAPGRPLVAPSEPSPRPHSQPLLPSLQTQPWLSSCRPAARGPGHHRPEPHSNARREAQPPHRQERASEVQRPDQGTTAKNVYDMGSQTWGFCPDAYSPSAPPSTNAELWDTIGFCHLLPRAPQEGIPSLCHKEGKASSVVGPDDRDKTLIPKPISSESHQKWSRIWTGIALKILPRFY